MRHPRAWQTQATSPGGTREASPRHKDRGPVRLAVKGKAVDAAWRVEGTRAHASCASGTRRSGPAREKRAGLAKSRPCAFSARHSPHWGEGKRDGQPPSPTKPGVSIALAMRYLPTREDL